MYVNHWLLGFHLNDFTALIEALIKKMSLKCIFEGGLCNHFI